MPAATDDQFEFSRLPSYQISVRKGDYNKPACVCPHVLLSSIAQDKRMMTSGISDGGW
jgi:hypothetical protein